MAEGACGRNAPSCFVLTRTHTHTDVWPMRRRICSAWKICANFEKASCHVRAGPSGRPDEPDRARRSMRLAPAGRCFAQSGG
eukprot:6190847-Pleurochrysis_carterae.AAC.2